MTRNNDLNKTVKVYYQDMQKYMKPLYCECCNTTVHHTSLHDHKKTEYHKIAQSLRNGSAEPIEDIKQKVIEYKMLQKYIRKTFNNDSTSNSDENNEDNNKIIDEKLLQRIKRKSAAYKRELDHRADMYERKKGIEILVHTINTCNKRLTKLQIEKYNNYVVKYPDNELLLSIQHLVPKKEQ